MIKIAITAMAKKSFRTRIKVTKRGKLLRRKSGQSHSRALKSQQLIQRRRNLVKVGGSHKKKIIGLL